MEFTSHMARLIFSVAVVVIFSSAAFGQEFVREGWPGEGTPRLAAKTDELVLHETPDSTSETRRLKYKTGWLIVWDQSKVITRKSARWTVKKEIKNNICGTLAPGVEVEFLQFELDGWGTFRVGDKLWSLKATRAGDFDKEDDRPQVEWWIRVLDNKKSPVGWLLVDSQQVEALARSFP